MLRRDYILRMLEQFFEVLGELLNKAGKLETEELENQLNKLYGDYLKADFEFFYNNDIDRIIEFLGRDSGNDVLYRAEMLAELLHQDGLLKTDMEMKRNLLNKALKLFEYIDTEGKTFSMERIKKMELIKGKLSEL